MGSLCCKETPNISLSCDNNGIVNSCCATANPLEEVKLYRWVYSCELAQVLYRSECNVWYQSVDMCRSDAERDMLEWVTQPQVTAALQIYEWTVGSLKPSRLLQCRVVRIPTRVSAAAAAARPYKECHPETDHQSQHDHPGESTSSLL